MEGPDTEASFTYVCTKPMSKSHETNPRTPFNSSAGDLKRTSPPLPPIRRSLISNISSTTNEKQHGGFIPSLGTSEVSTTN
ncbi:unnamed protein product [Rotaria sordida]|uniref:Uncharacterized protein n=1 Tax=Rotaria sordida TaxID=392033 RepID=A0A814XPR8_9BILA|nr:unnamed protein product [Rotaria sordida]